jgi:hypothetical protein
LDYNQINKGDRAVEMMLMTMMMEIDVEAFKILVPFSSCVVVVMETFVAAAMEVAERQGFAVVAMG